eukprot:4715000-Amphidinium_carterae.2
MRRPELLTWQLSIKSVNGQAISAAVNFVPISLIARLLLDSRGVVQARQESKTGSRGRIGVSGGIHTLSNVSD